MSLPRFLFPKQIVTDFTIHNLPYGVFTKLKNGGGMGRGRLDSHIGIAIGDKIIDAKVLTQHDLLPPCMAQPNLNKFMGAGKSVWQEVRSLVQSYLDDDSPLCLGKQRGLLDECIHQAEDCVMLLPASIGDYTDFYASREHATNIGIMFRGKDKALMPNWLHLPVGYHGRASTVVVSNTNIRRPWGQYPDAGSDTNPIWRPSSRLDIELEVAYFIGGVGGEEGCNAMGERISMDRVKDHIFGMVLMNDWSARDIQRWEYVPLGPFLGKSFGTTISPWVVPMEALEPFRCKAPQQEPTPLDYIRHKESDLPAIDIGLSVELLPSNGAKTPHPTNAVSTPVSSDDNIICRTNYKHMYWSMYQQVCHHTSNGCVIRPGDLMASGTISGLTPDSYGSMIELTGGGKTSLKLHNGTERSFLEDGDTVILRGQCDNGKGVTLGFGDCRGTIVPSANN